MTNTVVCMDNYSRVGDDFILGVNILTDAGELPGASERYNSLGANSNIPYMRIWSS